VVVEANLVTGVVKLPFGDSVIGFRGSDNGGLIGGVRVCFGFGYLTQRARSAQRRIFSAFGLDKE
jgi:hypothetical protein